jgi:magnesium transporter
MRGAEHGRQLRESGHLVSFRRRPLADSLENHTNVLPDPCSRSFLVVLEHALHPRWHAACIASEGSRSERSDQGRLRHAGGNSVAMVSELVRRTVRDRAGREARVDDLLIDLSAGDYPPVSALILTDGGRKLQLPWSAARWNGEQFEADDLGSAVELDEEQLAEMVLLKHGVMDALILDLVGERAVRANDVWLRQEDGQLVVRGIDVGPWAVIRRVARGWLGAGSDRRLLDARDVIYLRGEPRRAVQQRDYHRQILRLSAAQIARLAEALPYLHAAELIWLLPDELAADVFEFLSPERQIQVIGELGESKTDAVLSALAPDQAADVLGRLDLAEAKRLIERLPPERAALVTQLLRYPANSAGGIMTNELVTVPTGLSVAEALAHIRPQLAKPDLVYFVYVVDDPERRRLAGVVTLRELLISDGDRPLDEVMNRSMVTVSPDESARQAAYHLADNQLNALPVVGEDRRLLGAITVDSAVAQIAPETIRQDIPSVYA